MRISAVDLYRRIWRWLPRRQQLWLLDNRSDALARHLGTDASVVEPICVAGLLSSSVGMAEGARLCLNALTQLGYRIRNLDLSDIFNRHDLLEIELPNCPIEPGAGTLIVHLNPPMMPLGLLAIGRRVLAGKRIIGYWAWELLCIPPDWRQGLRYVDEIWVPSQFVAAAIRPFTEKPITVVPHPVAIATSGHRRRKDFAIPNRCFAALTIFHMDSCFERKNPLAAVRAFRIAFGDNPDALLIVKVTLGSTESGLMQQLHHAIAGASNIRLIDAMFTDQDTLDLIASVDVLVSLHRAEGFGLAMAQAMLSGTAVVATNWSGNLDFMTADSAALVSCGMIPVSDPQGRYTQTDQKWADPDVSEAAAALSRLAADRDYFASITKQAHTQASRALDLAAYRSAIGGRLPLPDRDASPL